MARAQELEREEQRALALERPELQALARVVQQALVGHPLALRQQRPEVRALALRPEQPERWEHPEQQQVAADRMSAGGAALEILERAKSSVAPFDEIAHCLVLANLRSPGYVDSEISAAAPAINVGVQRSLMNRRNSSASAGLCMPVRVNVRHGQKFRQAIILASMHSSRRLIRQKRFVLDGEAVILGVDGIADFCSRPAWSAVVGGINRCRRPT